MTSEIRTNSLKSRAGFSTVTMTDSGPMFSGITTFVDNSGFTFGVGSGSSIFTPATNVLTFGTNSNERLRIGSSGQIGLSGANYGTSGQVLTSQGSGSAATWTNISSTSDKIEEGDSKVEVVDSGTGYVNVVADSGVVARFGKENNNRTYMIIGNNIATQNNYGTNAGNVIIASNTTTRTATLRVFTSGVGLADDTVTGIIDFAAQQSGTGGQTVSKIESSLRGGVENKSDLIFSTSNAGSPTEKIRILADGKLGIGIASPAVLTHIYDSTNTSTATEQFRISGGNRTADTFETGFRFFTESPSANGNRHVRFTSNGNTGLIIQPIETSTGNAAVDRTIDLCPSGGRVEIGANGSGYGRLSVSSLDGVQAGGSAIQVMNTSAGTGDGSTTNLVLRSTNSVGTQWAMAEYRAHYHMFSNQGTEVLRTQTSGDYGSVETRNSKNGFGGYNIQNGSNWSWMADTNTAGLYNDTDNQWLITGTKGGDTFLYSAGSQTLRSYVTGDYGTIQTMATKNGWGGYSVAGQYVFMSNANTAGIYNDIDNEWMAYFNRNGGFHLFHDNALYLNSASGVIQAAQNIRFESKPNSGWGVGFYFGGNGQASSSTHASLCVTNGNIHMDPRNGNYGTYLNWYSGGSGVYFGNAASGQAGHITSSGNLTISGGYSGSDLRLKENIQNISGATDIIKSLVGKTYTWKKGIGLDDWNHYGLVAQEVQKVAPDLVRDNGSQFFDKDDNLVKEFDPTESDEDRKNKGFTQSLTVNYEGVTPILVEAMKELITKVESLEQENIALRSRVTNLEGE